MKVLSAQSYPTLCDPMDCSPKVSSGILQARILKWVAIPFSSGSSWPRDRTWVPCIAGRFFTIWATRKAQEWLYSNTKRKKERKDSAYNCHYLLPFSLVHSKKKKTQIIWKLIFLQLPKIRFEFISKLCLLMAPQHPSPLPATTDNQGLALVEIYRRTELEFPLYPGLLMSSWLMFRARCQAYILGKDHPER